MPFATEPRPRITGDRPGVPRDRRHRACTPGRESAVFRALQFGWFTTPLVLDEPDDILAALAHVRGPRRRAPSSPRSTTRAARGRLPARSRRGADRRGGADASRRASPPSTDGPVRYTAPSLVFTCEDGRRLEAGGWQPVEAYDVLRREPRLRQLERTPPPEDPLEALQAFPVPARHLRGRGDHGRQRRGPDPEAAEAALIDRVADGSVIRQALGDDALWLPAQRELDGSDPGRTASDRVAAGHRSEPPRAARR